MMIIHGIIEGVREKHVAATLFWIDISKSWPHTPRKDGANNAST